MSELFYLNQRLRMIIIISIILLLQPKLLDAQKSDSTKIVLEKIVTIDKKVNDINEKLNVTQNNVFNAFNRNIQTMVEDHQKSQRQLTNVYYIIYGFFALLLLILSLGGYIGLKSFRDLKKYSHERIDSLISAEVNNVQNRAANKLQELGLDANYMLKDIKEVIRLQQLYYQIFQLQSSDIQKEIALSAIINNSGTDNDLLISQLINLSSEREKPVIRSLSCMAMLLCNSIDVTSRSNAEKILRDMKKGNDEEKAMASEIFNKLSENNITFNFFDPSSDNSVQHT
jgi:hypothetical protein